MRRILVIRFSSLGDVVLSSTLLEALARRHPEAEIWLATKREYASLFEHDPRLTRLLLLGPERGALRAMAATLDTIPFDQVLDAHGSLRSRLLCTQLPPTPTRRIQKDTAARLLHLHTRVRPERLGLRLVDRYLELLDDAPATRPRLVLGPECRAEAASLLPDGAPVLAVTPGARHETKRWPEEHFTRLLRRFQQEPGGRVLLLGGPGEEELCARLAARLPEAPLLRTGAQRLDLLGALLQRCRLLVGNDSGMMHLAESVGTPVLALFGPTVREWGYFPLDPRSRVIEQELDCRPCSRTGSAPCRMPERWCLTRSDPERVHESLEEIWRTKR